MIRMGKVGDEREGQDSSEIGGGTPKGFCNISEGGWGNVFVEKG